MVRRFVGDEVRLEVGFAAARTRLANLIYGNPLKDASQEAYSGGITGLERVGPLGSAREVPRLVEVHFRDLVDHGKRCVLTLRWEATGPGVVLFPALDADITLIPVRGTTPRAAHARRCLPAAARRSRRRA